MNNLYLKIGEIQQKWQALKEKVEQTTTTEEAKEVIEEAGMELTDEELDTVAGGGLFSSLFVDWPVDFSDASG